jgi:hypothetical protein
MHNPAAADGNNHADGSGIGMVVRSALAAPSCQTWVGDVVLKVRLMVGSGAPPTQFHVPLVLETQLK